jgi:hypothetical protein
VLRSVKASRFLMTWSFFLGSKPLYKTPISLAAKGKKIVA